MKNKLTLLFLMVVFSSYAQQVRHIETVNESIDLLFKKGLILK